MVLQWSGLRAILQIAKQYTYINGKKRSDNRHFDSSVLRGTILGLIFFLCYVNDIFTFTKLATFFSDDTQCYYEYKNPNELDFVNIKLHKIANQHRSNKISVNVKKNQPYNLPLQSKKYQSY